MRQAGLKAMVVRQYLARCRDAMSSFCPCSIDQLEDSSLIAAAAGDCRRQTGKGNSTVAAHRGVDNMQSLSQLDFSGVLISALSQKLSQNEAD